jgi:hypothetical protein
MKHDELLKRLIEGKHDYEYALRKALRAVVELSKEELETKDMPTEQVTWYTYGYNLAMTKVYEAIEKELTPQSALRHAYLMDTGGK